MLTTRDGWNVSYETITYGEGKLQGCTLRVFRRADGGVTRCGQCDKQLFDTQEEAEEFALGHGHLKHFSWFQDAGIGNVPSSV